MLEIDNIYQGDCMNLLKMVDDKSIDVSFTSPPYNRKRNDKYSFYNDNITDYFQFLCAFTDELLRVTKKYVFVNIQKTYYNKQDVFKYIGKYSDKIVDIIIWEKSNPMPACGKNVTNAYEYFFVFGDKPLKSNYTYTKNVVQTSVYSNMPKEHKAVMKPEVCEWFIKNFTQSNDVILDPFLGLGTTAITAASNGRHYIGFELSEEYFNIAKKKLTPFTLFQQGC